MNVYMMSTSLSLAALSKEGVPRGGIPSRSYFEDHLTPGDGVGILEPNDQLAEKGTNVYLVQGVTFTHLWQTILRLQEWEDAEINR